MSDTSDPLTKQDIADALAELKVGRSRARARRYVRSILQRFGDGARNIDELDPKFYPAVFAAAGGDVVTAEKFYGAVVDLPPTITIPTSEEFYGVVLDVPAKHAKRRPPIKRPTLRLRTPLVADLERRLKERAGKPQSRPTYIVNIGNPGQVGDEDAVPEYPSDGRKMT